MIAAYEDLTPEALEPLGFDDPSQACRLLQEMAGHDIPDSLYNAVLAVLMPALGECADPDRAVANLVRWADAVGSRATAYQFLASSAPAARILVTVLAASQFFADMLIRSPEYLEALTNPRLRAHAHDVERVVADLWRLIGVTKTPNARRDALRRAKGPEILRIGVRDLFGEAPMPVIAREISDFADAAVQVALTICLEELTGPIPAFSVIAMGKLGGQELNYSSDIDLIFVHGDGESTVTSVTLAETLRDTIAKITPSGYVFRVDLRLRPEGRFGPVSRSLSSCRAYYESWAEPWERQALLKARYIAGDAELGTAFITMAHTFVFQDHLDEAIVGSIQQNKRRLEQKVARAGEADVNVKEGCGGIRDIEFPVQLLQMLAGGRHPEVRTGNTLKALQSLAKIGLIREEEQEVLTESYQFLRTVEHRLQLLDDQAVRCLPRDAGALRKLGRVLGYRDGQAFISDYRLHTEQVHRIFMRLFYQQPDEAETAAAPSLIADWVLSPDDPKAAAALRETLAANGFNDIPSSLAALGQAVKVSHYGAIPPEARSAFASLSERLIAAAGETANPDKALHGIDLLAQAAPSRAVLYRMLAENNVLLSRLCRLASDTDSLWRILLSHPEFLDILADDEVMDSPLPLSDAAPSPPSLARMALRARLHTGARDIWGMAGLEETLTQTTRTAETVINSALDLVRESLGASAPLAVIGLGKLGGAELGYGSDWDVLYIGTPEELTGATRLVEGLQHFLREGLLREGVSFDIDARLRPNGRKGALVLDVPTLRRYYTLEAATWERQALLKARFIGGDAALGRAMMDVIVTRVYGSSLTEMEEEEIRATKRRIEKERAKGPTDLKLGPGGLSDIEWTAQVLQLRHGHRRRRLRVTETLASLRTLRDEAFITQADWEGLDRAYRLVTRLRNHRFLDRGVDSAVSQPVPPETMEAMRHAHDIYRRLFMGKTA